MGSTVILDLMGGIALLLWGLHPHDLMPELPHRGLHV